MESHMMTEKAGGETVKGENDTLPTGRYITTVVSVGDAGLVERPAIYDRVTVCATCMGAGYIWCESLHATVPAYMVAMWHTHPCSDCQEES